MCKELIVKWEDADEPSTPADAARTLEELLADSRRYNERFEELGAPRGDEGAFERMREQNERGVELGEELLDALRAKEGPRAQRAIEELDVLGTESRALAREVGADECARNPTTEGLG